MSTTNNSTNKNEMNRTKSSTNMANTSGNSNQQNTSSNQAQKIGATTSKGAGKLKIAHRTRSKYQLSEISIAEIGSDLPNDLLTSNNSNNDIMGFNERNNEEVEPFSLASNLNSSHLLENYSNAASTPTATEDPQDDLWMEFLNR
jgi:hypothetical protein